MERPLTSVVFSPWCTAALMLAIEVAGSAANLGRDLGRTGHRVVGELLYQSEPQSLAGFDDAGPEQEVEYAGLADQPGEALGFRRRRA